MSDKDEPSLFQVTVRALEQIDEVLAAMHDVFSIVAGGREAMTPEKAAIVTRSIDAARRTATQTIRDVKAAERRLLDDAATPPHVM